jgi:TorA maturation chaperone TorD
MSFFRFDHCSQPDFLRTIGRAQLTRWLMPFAAELAAHGVALAADDFYQALAGLARLADGLSETAPDDVAGD